jgi:hypothetical protein
MRSMPEQQVPAFAADWEEWAASPLLYAISTWGTLPFKYSAAAANS